MTYSLLVGCIALLLLAARERPLVVSAVPSDVGYFSEHSTTTVANVEDGQDAPKSANNPEPACPCATSVNGTTTSSGQSDWSKQRQQQQHLEQFYNRNVMVHGMMCTCNMALRGAPMRDDYRYTMGIGAHKLHTRATTWNDARKICNEEGGHLAIINSIAEAHVSRASRPLRKYQFSRAIYAPPVNVIKYARRQVHVPIRPTRFQFSPNVKRCLRTSAYSDGR